jgi:large conductance mechanosensitive channel
MFLKEFREFAMKGSVVDLAVGVIIGAAFGKIVDSLVGDIVMPVVGRVIGPVDYSSLFIALAALPPNLPHTLDAVKKAGIPVIAYGNFANVVLNFILLALVIFIMVKQVNKLRREAPKPAAAPPAAPPEEVIILRQIRDTLKSQRKG